MITIVDYDMGNVGSLANMIKYLGGKSQLTSDPTILEKSQKIIIPGVGAFDEGMQNLQKKSLDTVLKKKALEEKIPIMGICLGMQLMANRSEEGSEKGLCLIDAEFRKFPFEDKKLKVPHMGWNFVTKTKESKIFENTPQENKFYFVHSFYCFSNNDIAVGKTNYGFDFISMYEKENILGVQFHPEKSHKYGMALLKNFIEKY